MTLPLPAWIMGTRALDLDSRRDTTGVIPVGGKNRRTGKDKAQLDKEGKSFLNFNTLENHTRLEKGLSS